MPTLTVAGEPFRVELDGPEDAPPLLLSNSLSSDLTMWDEVLPALSARFRVIRYDTRGHGGSAITPGPYTLARLGQDALGVLDAVGVARAHWCGLSLGGMTGMWVLTHAPERLDRAVLANTSAHMGPRELWEGRIRFARDNGMAATVEPTLARWFPGGFLAANPGRRTSLAAMVAATPPEGYAGCCAAIRDMDQREAIRSVAAPVLVVTGARDPATTPEAGEVIRAAIPGARSVSLDAGHISAVERPGEFAAAVTGFLLGEG